MAVKKGMMLAGAVAAGSPVVGYFVYSHLTGGSGQQEDQPQQTTSLEPTISGSSFYATSSNFKAGSCSKKLFSNVDFKFLTGGTSKDEFDLKWGTESGTVEACLILHAKQQTETKAIAASTELAAIQGNKGLVMWTVVLGKPSKGTTTSEEIRLVVLEKNNDKWEAKRGFSWFTKAGAASNKSRAIKIKVSETGSEAKTFDNSEGKLWEGEKEATDYRKEWTFKEDNSSGTEQVFSKLAVTYKGDKTSGLFGTNDYEIPRASFLYGTMDTEWKWSPKDKGFYKKVEIPFKGTKGKWEEVTTAQA